MMPAQADARWPSVLERIAKRTTPQQFATWFRNVQPVELGDPRVVLRVPSKFHRDWIVTYYREVVEESVSAVLGGPRELHVDVAARDEAAAERTTAPPVAPVLELPRAAPGKEALGRNGPARAPAEAALAEGHDLARFVVGPCNQMAAAAATSLATGAEVDFKLLLVLGATGTGKTHLLQGAARAAAQAGDARRHVAYVRGETFVNEFVTACAQGAEAASRFRERWRSLELVCFDDLQLLAGKAGTQAELLHTLNAWGDRGTRVIFAASCAPGEALQLDPQLQARLANACRVGLRAPDRDTRLALLEAKAKARQESLPPEVLHYLAELPTSNVRELEGALTSVLACARFTGAALTLKSARAALQEDTLLQRPSSSPDRILKAVCQHFEVTTADLSSPRRPQALSFARQAAMYLLRERTELSLSEIGQLLGGRDHTTILHGVRKVEETLAEDRRVREHLDRVRALLER